MSSRPSPASRSRPARRASGATRRCCRSPPTSPPSAPPTPASPGWSTPATSPPTSGCKQLWVKDDSGNPTHSFKDRVVAVALSAARELGLKVLACPSTGNLANAVAAAAARAGINSVVLVPSNLEQQKIIASAVYDTTLIAIEGNYDDVNKLASEIAAEEEGWAFVNVNVRPYYAEGSKTLAFEIAEQLGWRLPDQIVIPVASGSQLTKIDKGFAELIKLGLVEDKPVKIFGAQATGCSPIAQAYRAGHDFVAPVKPNTIAKSLAIGNPADGPYVLDVVRRTGGCVADVDDDVVVAQHPAAGPDRGHLRRDRRRRDHRRDRQADRRRAARPRRRDRGDQLRRRAQDPRRGGRPGRPQDHHPAALRGVHRLLEGLPAHECDRPHPDHPAHLHRRRGRGERRRRHAGARCSTRWRPTTPASAAASSTTPARCAGSSTSTSVTRTSASSAASTPRSPDGAKISIIPAVAGG